MKELGNPTILARVPVMKPEDKEQLLFNRFKPQRVPQTEYFQLDQEQLEFVLNACASWMEEVQRLIVEPHVPEDVQVNQRVIRAEPMPQYVTPEMEEERREFDRKLEEEMERLRQEVKAAGVKPPETKEQREKREREEYQAWVKGVEDSLKPPE